MATCEQTMVIVGKLNTTKIIFIQDLISIITINHLPDPITDYIVQFLPPASAANLAFTSHSFFKIVMRNTKYWQKNQVKLFFPYDEMILRKDKKPFIKLLNTFAYANNQVYALADVINHFENIKRRRPFEISPQFIDITDGFFRTGLHYAILNENLDAATQLLKAGAKITLAPRLVHLNSTKIPYSFPYQKQVTKHYGNFFSHMFDTENHIRGYNRVNYIQASEKGKDLLKQHFAYTRIQDELRDIYIVEYISPLHLAVETGSLEMVQLLVEHDELTHINSGVYRTAEFYIEKNVLVPGIVAIPSYSYNPATIFAETDIYPISRATELGHLQIVKCLLEKNSKYNLQRDFINNNVLDKAKGEPELLKALEPILAKESIDRTLVSAPRQAW